MPYPPPPAPKQRGCLRTVFILFAILVVLAIGGIAWSYYSFLRTAMKYTSGQAAPIPVEKISTAQYEQIRHRIDLFTSHPPGSKAMLQLSAGDLNGLIAAAPEWEGSRGKCYIKIKDERVVVMGSIEVGRMRGIPMPGLRGKYVNGALYCLPTIDGGKLRLMIDKVTVNTEPLPRNFQRNLTPGLERGAGDALSSDKILAPIIATSYAVKVEGDNLVFLSR